MKLQIKQLRKLISESSNGGGHSVDVDFFDEDGKIAELFPRHPVTVSIVSEHQGMPVVLVEGPRELVKEYLLSVYSDNEQEIEDLLNEYYV